MYKKHYICIMAGKKDIVITNVPDKTTELINNIVGNLGIPRSQYLKYKLRAIIESEPEHLKRKKIEF